MTKLGYKFIGNPAMEQGQYEEDEVEVVKRYLNHIDIFINVGANIGYYCCIALNLGKHTIAFEPIDLNLAYMYRNIMANGWQDNVEIYPIALGSSCGLVNIFGSGHGASLIRGAGNISENSKRVVPIATLDTVLSDRLSGKRCFFLVDIEGATKLVLQGAFKHLRLNPKPIWLVEIWINEHQPRGIKLNPDLLETFDIFWRNGYRSWRADKSGVEITRRDVTNICEKGVVTFPTRNFLFIHESQNVL